MKNLLFIFFPALLCAELTLSQLQEKPKGYVRDFHVWLYMQNDINATQADEAYSLLNKSNSKILKLYANKTENALIKKKYQCTRAKTAALLAETNSSCVNEGLSYNEAMGLSKDQRASLAETLKEDFASKSALLCLMNKKPFILSLINSGAHNYLTLFNSLGSKHRRSVFNVKLSKDDINKLAKDKGFNKAIKYIVTDKKMDKMQASLLQLSPHNLSAQSNFFLALNALKFKAVQKASFYLEIAEKQAYYQMDKDKAVFWLYQILKKDEHLKKLTSSTDINIYTLYAKEKLQMNVDNYFYALDLDANKSSHDITDPYIWEELLQTIRHSGKQELLEMRKKFNTQADEVVSAFIYAKALSYKKHNYIMPYKKATNSLTNDDKALLYALARQESHFIPSALSRSYALGVMQIMPFLVKHLAKQNKESIELTEMFNPYKNISYSIRHISYLKKHLYHPLFIAYAYNGGIGFTKRHLLGGSFLKNSFEPYLSMELMANTESREYGKKVLANYVVYKKILGEEVKITSLFQRLTEPSRTDRFRMKVLAAKH